MSVTPPGSCLSDSMDFAAARDCSNNRGPSRHSSGRSQYGGNSRRTCPQSYMCANVAPCTPRPVATEVCTGIPRAILARVFKSRPGYSRLLAAVAEAGGSILRSTIASRSRLTLMWSHGWQRSRSAGSGPGDRRKLLGFDGLTYQTSNMGVAQSHR